VNAARSRSAPPGTPPACRIVAICQGVTWLLAEASRWALFTAFGDRRGPAQSEPRVRNLRQSPAPSPPRQVLCALSRGRSGRARQFQSSNDVRTSHTPLVEEAGRTSCSIANAAGSSQHRGSFEKMFVTSQNELRFGLERGPDNCVAYIIFLMHQSLRASGATVRARREGFAATGRSPLRKTPRPNDSSGSAGFVRTGRQRPRGGHFWGVSP
jgi:hypothetical protein